jgi:hypothetical protein
MESSDARKLKALKDENRRLKKLLAESMLDVSEAEGDARKKLLTPNLRRRTATWAVRERRVTRSAEPVGSSICIRTLWVRRSASEDLSLCLQAAGRQRSVPLRNLASQRRRFGYRCLELILERQGIKLNGEKLYRLYKEERLTRA